MVGEFQRDEALFHFRRGVMLERANRQEEAVAEYRRAIARDPHLCEAHSALAGYYERRGLLAKAVEALRVVANLQNDFLAHFHLAYLLIDLRRYDEALASLDRCLQLEPDDPLSHYHAASARFLLGDARGALELLEVPMRACPDDWSVHHLYGNCQLRLGALGEAHGAFERAMRLAPYDAARQRCADRLRAVARLRAVGAARTIRDLLYVEHGAAYLGSAQDGGWDAQMPEAYHFTYPDIGVTLRRLMALCAAGGLRQSCVAPLDRQAAPLASALAELLGLPLRTTESGDMGDAPLLVLATDEDAELLRLARERLPASSLTFCLGLCRPAERELLPDVIGVAARATSSVPWAPELHRLRALGASARLVQRCLDEAAAQIIAAVRDAPPDPLAPALAEHYRRLWSSQELRDVSDGSGDLM